MIGKSTIAFNILGDSILVIINILIGGNTNLRYTFQQAGICLYYVGSSFISVKILSEYFVRRNVGYPTS